MFKIIIYSKGLTLIDKVKTGSLKNIYQKYFKTSSETWKNPNISSIWLTYKAHAILLAGSWPCTVVEGHTAVFTGAGRDSGRHCVGGTWASVADIMAIQLKLVCDGAVSAASLAGQGQIGRGQQHCTLAACNHCWGLRHHWRRAEERNKGTDASSLLSLSDFCPVKYQVKLFLCL